MTLTKLILLILAINLIGTFFKKMQQKRIAREREASSPREEEATAPEPDPEPAFNPFEEEEGEPEIFAFEKKEPAPVARPVPVEPVPTALPEQAAPAPLPVTPPKLAVLNAPRRNTVALNGRHALQQAFIYSEIFGKPVGLRENESTYN